MKANSKYFSYCVFLLVLILASKRTTVATTFSPSLSPTRSSWQSTNSGVGDWISLCTSYNGMYSAAITYSVVEQNNLYLSKDYGINWVATSLPNQFVGQYQSVAMGSGGMNLTVVGSIGSIAISLDYGESWDLVAKNESSACTIDLNFVAVSAAMDYIYAGGSESTGICISNTSSAFVFVNISSHPVAALACSGSGQYVGAIISFGTVYVSSNYGLEWRIAFSQSDFTPSSLTMSSSGQLVTVAATLQGSQQVVMSSNYGVSWSIAQVYSEFPLLSIDCDSSGQFLITNSEYNIYVSDDFGHLWTLSNADAVESWSVVCSSGDGTLLLAGTSTGAVYENSLNITFVPTQLPTSSVKQWSRTDSPNLYWSYIVTSISGQVSCAISEDDGDGIYNSFDYGKTWLKADGLPSDLSLYTLCISSSGEQLIVGGANGLLGRSNDSGLSWNISYVDSSINFWSMACSQDLQYIYVVDQSLYVSTDYGYNFAASPVFDYAESVRCSSTGQYVIVISENLYWSSDYSIEFSTIFTGYVGVASISASGQYMTLTNEESYLYYSTNYGAQFLSTSFQMEFENIVSDSSGQYLVASCYFQYLFQSIDFGASWILTLTLEDYMNWGGIASNGNGDLVLAGAYYIYSTNNSAEALINPTRLPSRTPSMNPTVQPSMRPTLTPTISPIASNWKKANTSIEKPVSCITTSQSGEYSMACSSGVGCYYSHDFGVSWLLSSSEDLSSVDFVGVVSDHTGKNVTAVGILNGRNVFLVSYDFGLTLVEKNFANVDSAPTCIAASSTLEYIFIGQNNMDLLVHPGYGSFVTAVTLPTSFSAIACSQSGQYVLIGSNSMILVSENFGQSFSQTYEFTVANSGIAVAMASESGQLLYAVCDYDNILLFSENYGRNWSSVTLPSSINYFSTIACDQTGQFLVTSTDTGGIIQSSDFGQSWIQTGQVGAEYFASNWEGSLLLDAEGETIYFNFVNTSRSVPTISLSFSPSYHPSVVPTRSSIPTGTSVPSRSYVPTVEPTAFMYQNREINALYDFYVATNGSNWILTTGNGIPWNFSEANPDPCTSDWYGIVCEDTFGDEMINIVELYLPSSNLVGTIPASLVNLSFVDTIDFSHNYLFGALPNLDSLPCFIGDVYLNDNYFTGTIPQSYNGTSLCSEASELNSFDVSDNLLEGTLPILSLWLYLNVSFNQLTGTIPSCSAENMIFSYNMFTDWQELVYAYEANSVVYLDLSSNNLNSFPVNITNFISLQYLYINGSGLTGTIPSELFDMQLEYLSLINNNLGSFANISCGRQDSQLQLNISCNVLTGSLPSSILECTSVVDAQYNLFSGPLIYPNASFVATNLVYLDVSNNQFSGILDFANATFPIISSMYLSDNQFTGPIPTSFNSELLNFLYASGNTFSGTLPTSLAALTGCAVLYFDDNFLTGTLPSALKKLTQLVTIVLNNNLLSGTIPPTYSGISSLQTILLYENMLSGNLNVFNASLQKSLVNIDVSNNEFTGTIPEEIFNIGSLQSFAAVSNCLKGTIPNSICSAMNLTTFVCDGLSTASACRNTFFNSGPIKAYGLRQRMEGTIPGCLFQLDLIETLHISGTGMTGTIPNLNSISNSLTDLSLSHNALIGEAPQSIMTHPWTNLDLSYNKLKNVLPDSMSSYPDGSSLSLEVNRMSGGVPQALDKAMQINILNGNIFQCNSDKSDLPQYDNSTLNYQCGSDSFNSALYTWLGILGIIALISCALYFYSQRMVLLVNNVNQWLSVFSLKSDEKSFDSLILLGSFFSSLRVGVLYLTAFVVLVLMPVYALLTVTFGYGTYKYQFAWLVSGIYLSGVNAVIVLMAFYLACFLVAVLLYRKLFNTKTTTEIDDSSLKTTHRLFLYGYIVAVILIDMVIMTGVNIGYVIVTIKFSATTVHITQVLIAGFKLFWNSVALRFLMSLLKKCSSSASLVHSDILSSQYRVRVEVIISLFNNTIAPFIAVAFVTSDCFYNVIVAAPKVDSVFYYSVCDSYHLNHQKFSDLIISTSCLSHSQQLRTTSYAPPFVYSYQCSSTFIATYANVYVFMFVITSFLVPFVHFGVWYSTSLLSKDGRSFDVAQSMLPALLRSPEWSSRDKKEWWISSSKVLFKSDLVVVQIVSMLAIGSTFGVVVPLIAVVGCATVWIFTYYHQILCGHFMIATEGVTEQLKEELNRNCTNITTIFANSIGFVVPFVCLFYSLLLFDILGDKVGARKAIAVPVVVCCIPLSIWFYRHFMSQINTKTHETSEKPVVVEVEMNPMDEKA